VCGVRTLGAGHVHTATCYGNLATCLQAHGEHAEALALCRKALAVHKKALGENHPSAAQSYDKVAGCLSLLGRRGEALALSRKALTIRRKVLGERHPDTAQSYAAVASGLSALGRHAEALPLYRKALAINKSVLGEEHPRTAAQSTNLAGCLWLLGRVGEAVRLLSASLPGQEAARFHRAASGFDRALGGYGPSPHALLALGLARQGEPGRAFAHAEASLARALLDDLAPAGKHADLAALERELRRLDRRLLPLLGRVKLAAPEKKLREGLLAEHRAVRSRLARLTAAGSSGLVLGLAEIQGRLPADAALVLWLDVEELGEHWACVVRAKGKPAWRALKGSGKGGAWTAKDRALPGDLYRLLSDPGAGTEREARRLRRALLAQRLDPLGPHLKAKGGLPAVRQLLVVPVGWAGAVPVEALSTEYRISYVPSGSAFTRLRKGHRALSGRSLLALGDPTFTRLKSGDLPPRPLPGTRREVLALRRLVLGGTVLLGSDASEQRLDELASAGKLRSFRLIHLATHGSVDWERPERSRLFLARDRLPDPLEQVRRNKPVYTGELTVQAIRERWKLDADLVVLSACQTGLGKERYGDGMLGFAHAFLSRGARCVVLSRWQVDDEAASLLMLRFYEDLLGKKPLGRAAALEEARSWLRKLPRKEAERLAGALALGKLKSTRGAVGPLPRGKGAKVPGGERPYDHPYYWAAFVLIGDPD
jgi:CHAT domain-containing protein/tetratricopeptide (TPR) repeat protein